jgi:hypothetical protein
MYFKSLYPQYSLLSTSLLLLIPYLIVPHLYSSPITIITTATTTIITIFKDLGSYCEFFYLFSKDVWKLSEGYIILSVTVYRTMNKKWFSTFRKHSTWGTSLIQNSKRECDVWYNWSIKAIETLKTNSKLFWYRWMLDGRQSTSKHPGLNGYRWVKI